MIGLVILIIIALWFLLSVFLSRYVTNKIIIMKTFVNKIIGYFVGLFLTTVIFILPLIDEILAKPQFEKLCKEHSNVLVKNIFKGEKVFLDEVKHIPIKGTWIEIINSPRVFREDKTKEIVVRYDMLTASGGFLVNFFGFPEDRSPILFSSSCGSKYSIDTKKIFQAIGVIEMEDGGIE